MNQVSAVVEKSIRESVRDRMVLFWTYAVPLFFLLALPLLYAGTPAEIALKLKGGLTLTMVTFLVMTAGQSNLPGLIAADRERGLYLKMASMPVSPWKEGVGRTVATWAFSLSGAVLVLTAGFLYGARFDYGLTEALTAFGFSFLTAVASVGVGLMNASLVKGESAATHTGVALTLLTYFLGGMAIPYSKLPAALRAFSRLHPISSANACMIRLLEGEAFVGYDPLNMAQVASTVSLSVLLFVVGLTFYSKFCWRRE